MISAWSLASLGCGRRAQIPMFSRKGNDYLAVHLSGVNDQWSHQTVLCSMEATLHTRGNETDDDAFRKSNPESALRF